MVRFFTDLWQAALLMSEIRPKLAFVGPFCETRLRGLPAALSDLSATLQIIRDRLCLSGLPNFTDRGKLLISRWGQREISEMWETLRGRFILAASFLLGGLFFIAKSLAIEAAA